jgi:TonB-dependent SusC/RagA subfamily outer membrane receptor
MRSIFLIVLTLFFCYPGTVTAQKAKKVIITGKVTDAVSRPVSGANIFIDKQKTDVVTDQNGHYRIKVKPDAEEILVFSVLNGASEQKVNGRTEIDFILMDESGTGNVETNVTKKSGTLNIKDSAVPVYQDIYDMIRGRVAGVEVSGKSIKIRGSNSLNISTEPLFVVDGVIVKDIEDIDPVMVKSIEVLKGPDATVYGTRGSNGVIVITRRTE